MIINNNNNNNNNNGVLTIKIINNNNNNNGVLTIKIIIVTIISISLAINYPRSPRGKNPV